MHKPYEPDPLRIGDCVTYVRENVSGTIKEFCADGGIVLECKTGSRVISKKERNGGLFNGSALIRAY